MSYGLLTLAWVTVSTVATYVVSRSHVSSGGWGRLYLTLLIGGLWFYSGVGLGYEVVGTGQKLAYLGFLFVLAAAFPLAYRGFRGVPRAVGPVLSRFVEPSRTDGRLWYGLLVAYFVLLLVPLAFPVFRLGDVLSPPAPDLRTLFEARFNSVEGPVNGFPGWGQLKLLGYPFFLIALWRLRQRLVMVIGLMSSALYLEYVREAYLNRSTIGVGLAMLWLFLWYQRPRMRVAMLIVTALGLPGVGWVAYQFSHLRLGREVESVGPISAAGQLIQSETVMPVTGARLLETGRQIDLGGYMVWVATLPVPRVVTGPTASEGVNYEASSIVLGREIGASGWYVVLPGLAAESVFIYGYLFFWLHALGIAILAALFCRSVEASPSLGLVALYGAMLFGYSLNRGGISSLLPVVMNQFLPFYLFIGLVLLGRIARGSGRVSLEDTALPHERSERVVSTAGSVG